MSFVRTATTACLTMGVFALACGFLSACGVSDSDEALRGVPINSTPANVEIRENPISFSSYTSEFGISALVDLPTRSVQNDIVSKIETTMVGTQIRWDGYVQELSRGEDGGVVILISPKAGPTSVDVAFVRFSSVKSIARYTCFCHYDQMRKKTLELIKT